MALMATFERGGTIGRGYEPRTLSTCAGKYDEGKCCRLVLVVIPIDAGFWPPLCCCVMFLTPAHYNCSNFYNFANAAYKYCEAGEGAA